MRFVLAYQKAIDQITADKSLKLQQYELDNNDWNVIEDLVSVFEKYKKATLFFSCDSVGIMAIIPAMDKLDNHLNSHMKKPYYPTIQAAMKLTCAKINQYYLMTDLSSVYCIAMVLHPGLKLEYFKQQDWEQDWVDNVENLVRNEYVIHYEGKESLVATAPADTIDSMSRTI